MKIGHTIDANGYLTGDILEESKVIPTVTVLCPDGLYKPKWNSTAWVEGLTQAEVNAIKNATKKPSLEARMSALESAMLSRMKL